MIKTNCIQKRRHYFFTFTVSLSSPFSNDLFIGKYLYRKSEIEAEAWNTHREELLNFITENYKYFTFANRKEYFRLIQQMTHPFETLHSFLNDFTPSKALFIPRFCRQGTALQWIQRITGLQRLQLSTYKVVPQLANHKQSRLLEVF